jgi:hypothetical protein
MTPVVVIAVAVGALLIGLAMVGSPGSPYDEIGGEMFDRPGGRGPSDAEYAEYGAVLASLCEDEDAREDSGS